MNAKKIAVVNANVNKKIEMKLFLSGWEKFQLPLLTTYFWLSVNLLNQSPGRKHKPMSFWGYNKTLN